MLRQLVAYTKLRGLHGTTLSDHNSHHMDKSNRSVTVAATAASEVTVTTVTMFTNIFLFLRVPFKVPKPFMAVTVGYGVEEADGVPLGGLFDFSLYCNLYNMATAREALQGLRQLAQSPQMMPKFLYIAKLSHIALI